MKLLHWNVHSWRDAAGVDNRSDVLELIRSESPDVVSLVEVDEPSTEPMSLAQLAEKLGYAWVFVPAFEYRSAGGYGNALLVRGSIDAVRQWELLSPRTYDGTEPSEQRTVVAASVRYGGRSLWLGSTHLPRGVASRAEATARLLQLLPQFGTSWLLCGDFNQPPDAWIPSDLTFAPHPAAPTCPSDAPSATIDYCIFTGVTVTGHALQSTASDHLPITITADLRQKPTTRKRRAPLTFT